MAGVRDVLRQQGVASLLEGQAQRAASRCNSLYALDTEPYTDPYGSGVVTLAHNAAGVVYTRTKMGRIDNMKNNTLKKGCGC